MSLHKLTAGSGYDYLTRQVAALDATNKGRVGLASYYTEKGETPGTWVGSGLAGIDGLDAGDPVTAEQMQDLFGAGKHPLATERSHALDLRIGRPDLPTPTLAEHRAATRLGAPFKVYDNDLDPFRLEVARRLTAFNQNAGLPADWPVAAEQRARIRTEVGRDLFRTAHGRDPADARELVASIATHSRPRTTAVAGYDLTFSPVKSVSVLWALADPATAATIERAHQAAIADAVSFLEQHSLYTRLGTNGVRQVDVRGLVAVAFTHRDSRAGDPDLHTHLAVANKVQTLDGKWRAIDGRLLYKAKVSASETYNTALERHLSDTLGVRFADRTDSTLEPVAAGAPPQGARGALRDRGKRKVREIVGVDPDLNRRFSKRRVSVESRRSVLASEFQATHGRPPTPVEMLHLAQQATLETREAKHEPRTLAEQRTAWHHEAAAALGSPHAVQRMIRRALHPDHTPPTAAAEVGPSPGGPAWVHETAERILTTLESSRATWQYWHVYAEAQRQVRRTPIPTDRVAETVQTLVHTILGQRSVSLTRDRDPVAEPVQLRRADRASVYTVHGARLFTSRRVLAAEQRLVEAAGRRDGFTVPVETVGVVLLEAQANGVALNPGQARLVEDMATSGARVQLALAPAGSGKTTAMRALTQAWTAGGGHVIGLAPSAAAAEALRTAITTPTGVAAEGSQDADTDGGAKPAPRTDTLAKLIHSLTVSPTHDSHTLGGASGDASGGGSGEFDWVAGIGPSTLVVIDEAGMADTLSLDLAVQHVLARGGSVRLIGDDQQLAAIGAGGVLRDIATTHGALQLSELVRFSNPAEAAASLALREGRTEALGFYLDHHRVHVGDQATMTQAVFDAWQHDCDAGLDALMLAPTRDLVADLNQQARAHRLTHSAPRADLQDPVRRLADGNEASAGDVVITRSNDRHLRVSATDWVKNGDRWRVRTVHEGGDLTLTHLRHGRTVRIPSSYVDDAVELGYACTVHTAQGVTAQTMHGLATGTEPRQQLYTMLTRGKDANHVYLPVVGDGDPHSVIHPDLIHPRTPTDVLESVLARDDAPRSATTLQRDDTDAATRLGAATQRYLDSLSVAAEHHLGPAVVNALDTTLETLLPGVTDEAAWPALRAHLLLLGAAGADPVSLVRQVVDHRKIVTAEDRAAVLDWRLHDTGQPNTGQGGSGTGPLPWTPAIPPALAANPHWGEYLTRRAQLVEDLARQVADRATAAAAAGTLPAWAGNGTRPAEAAVVEVEVWRAAMQVDPADRRPTGPPQTTTAAARWQRRLDLQVRGNDAPALLEWAHLLHQLAPQTRGDDFTPHLAQRLAAIARTGLRADQLLRSSAAAGPLPDDHAAAALWWRMAPHLTPAVAHAASQSQQPTRSTQSAQRSPAVAPGHQPRLNDGVTDRLADLLGAQRVAALQASSWWPALVTNLDHALQRGWRLEDLLTASRRRDDAGGSDVPCAGAETSIHPAAAPASGATKDADLLEIDDCQALVWRTSLALDPIPADPDDPATAAPPHPADEPPTDMWDLIDPDKTAASHPVDGGVVPACMNPAGMAPATAPGATATRAEDLAGDLRMAGYLRELRGITPLEPTEADIRRMYQRAEEWDHCPVTRERMLEINHQTQRFYEQQYRNSWSRAYLTHRFGIDLAGHEDVQPGHAPAGWTNLVDHLRQHGVSDTEMLATGVATRARTGRLIDRFRNRVTFPILAGTTCGAGGADGPEILGFVARRRPDATDPDTSGPKYLNTPTTPLFHKGSQLYGLRATIGTESIPHEATPVVVEGPMDAVAVTLASAGRYRGVAPLGTALTDEQATHLARTGRHPVIATDADTPGQHAAERAFWLLAPHGLDPGYAELPPGYDPASLLTNEGPAALVAALKSQRSLGHELLTRGLTQQQPALDALSLTQIVAALPSSTWHDGASRIAAQLGQPEARIRDVLLGAVNAWDDDPRRTSQLRLSGSSSTPRHLQVSTSHAPAEGLPSDAAINESRPCDGPDQTPVISRHRDASPSRGTTPGPGWETPRPRDGCHSPAAPIEGIDR